MSIDTLITPELIKTTDFPLDPIYKIRIANAVEDKKVNAAFLAGHLEVQAGGYTGHYCNLNLVGSQAAARPVASLNLNLRQFEEVVRYDPANPPSDEHLAQKMVEYHAKTQSDFKGGKQRNLVDYTDYGLAAMRGEHKANIPEINGWCDVDTSDKTLFVVLHMPEPGFMYGKLFLPSLDPVMQADGQTQTAMLFKLARTKLGTSSTENFRVKLEVEFGVTAEDAGQAFADRNGRGVKKNRNLVVDLTSVGGISTIMKSAIPGTIFEGRTFNGRGQGISESSTTMIIDLATLEQVVVNACTYGNAKPEHIKDIHVDTYLPVVKDFLALLERRFGHEWKKDTPENEDPYRVTKVHGWSFAFKALAKAYYRTRMTELGPLAHALRADTHDTVDMDTEEAWKARAKKLSDEDARLPPEQRKYREPISTPELETRLGQIDWTRHKQHWVDITGFTRSSSTGRPNTKTLKDGTIVIKAKAPTQKEVIAGIEGIVLGSHWEMLKGSGDFDWDIP